MKQMKKILLPFLLLPMLLSILFSPTGASAAADPPSVNFSAKASQEIIVKPQNADAIGGLDLHLMPKGMATNPERDPIDLIFIFDKSGSMNESGRNPKKFQDAKDAIEEAVKYFKEHGQPGDRFGLVPFDTKVSDRVVYFSFNDFISNLNKIEDTVNTLSASGGTNYTQSFEKALEMLGGQTNGAEKPAENQYVIFMTDGEPTFSNYKEAITYQKQVQVGTREDCFLFWCSTVPVYEKKTVTENVLVYHEIYTDTRTGRDFSEVYYYLNGNRYTINQDVNETKRRIKQHGINMAQSLAQKDIKLYSIGFGNDSEVDMDYLRKLSSVTGVTARQASQGNISEVFRAISGEIDTPSISGEITVDLNKFNGKVKLQDGANATITNGIATIKFDLKYPLNQSAPQPIDFSLPLSFTQAGDYVFDNIKLSYRDIDGKAVAPITHAPVKISVKDDAAPSMVGEMSLKGVINNPDNLIKFSGSNERTNEFKVNYSLSPNGLFNNQVKGNLSNIQIVQPLPSGVSLIPSEGVKLITGQDGRPAAQITLGQSINYASGVFSPNSLAASLNLKGDWALNNVKMPTAYVTYKDSRFGEQQASIAPANQFINLKVRLNEMGGKAYDGYASGLINKVDLNNNNTVVAQTEFPNDYGLKPKPIKDMEFVGDKNTAIKVTYSDNEEVIIYLTPDFEMTGQDSGVVYKDGDVTSEKVNVDVTQLVAGKGVKYYYSIENPNGNIGWTEFDPSKSIVIDDIGKNTIRIKAEGGFAFNTPVEKDITLQVPVESIHVTPNPLELEVDEVKSFTVNISPLNASNKDLDIYIEDQNIAEYKGDMRIIGKAEGETYLVVKAKDGSGITVRVPVIVKDAYIGLKEIKFIKSVFKIEEGEEIALSDVLIFNPNNATDKDIESLLSTLPDKVSVRKEGSEWYIIGEEVGYSTVTAEAEKQRDQSKPKASALFEVGPEGADHDSGGSNGAGRW
ncbi:VWA domain-containing protein [Cytobacillus gottheilii]|uniref:VWA domain-containing protein n=1 Tax=Cytobacillus gottheilii TaxID=859144 RepID=UPI00249486AC|nr:VWA domain-containing protein [Cytobacillus gottheilii]